jgi:hypothetical protein
MDFNKETIKLFKEKLATILVNLFPGLLILELFFNYGFFHNNINNLYSFILYLIYGFSISIIFDFLFSISLYDYIERKARNYFKKANKTIPDDFEEFIKPKGDDFEEKLEEIEAILNIVFYCLLIFIAYFFKSGINIFVDKINNISLFYNINFIFEANTINNVVVLVVFIMTKKPVQYIFTNIILSSLCKELYESIKHKYNA